MFRFPRILSRQAVVITLALVVTIPVLAYPAEPMGSASAAQLEMIDYFRKSRAEGLRLQEDNTI